MFAKYYIGLHFLLLTVANGAPGAPETSSLQPASLTQQSISLNWDYLFIEQNQ